MLATERASYTMEHTLTLANGRTLVYQEAGDTKSNTVVLSLHNWFSYGKIDTESPAPVFENKSIHRIHPTLPGWGKSTPYPSRKPYTAVLYSSITSLLDHTRAVAPKHLYILGYAFGTVPAQPLYGAPYSEFPYGRLISGVLILNPFSPFTRHKGYAKDFIWPRFLILGPPARYLPFLRYSAKRGMSRNFADEQGSRALMKKLLTGDMTAQEKQDYERWKAIKGKTDDQVVEELVHRQRKSTEYTWAGFLGHPAQLRKDWGFKVDELDEEHTRAQIFIVAADRDDYCPPNMARWLDSHYKNSKLKILSGGRFATTIHMDEILEEFLSEVPSVPKQTLERKPSSSTLRRRFGHELGLL